VLLERPKICADPAKRCGAGCLALWHAGRVTPATFQSLAELCPAIKLEWAALLRGEPTITPLGRPDTLVFLMDATLAQLFAGLTGKSEAKWLHSCTPLIAPVHRYCACGLNPLLKYFTTGELALRAATAPLLGEEIEDLLLLFRSLAQQEIEALCTVCQHKDIPGCCELAEEKLRPSPTGGATSRAKASAPPRRSSGTRG
jgi:hypothetical protein